MDHTCIYTCFVSPPISINQFNRGTHLPLSRRVTIAELLHKSPIKQLNIYEFVNSKDRHHTLKHTQNTLLRLVLTHAHKVKDIYIYIQLVQLRLVLNQLYTYIDRSKNLDQNFLFLSIFFYKEFHFFFIYFSFIFSTVPPLVQFTFFIKG